MPPAAAAINVRPLVGREAEIGTLAEAVQRADIPVIFLHGIAGMGKSALLREFLSRESGGGGASVVQLDCRMVEPTERGFLHSAGGFADVRALVRYLGALPAPVIVALDHYEVFRLMDTWLRQVLVPMVPSDVTVILVGRERPVAAWFAASGFRTMPLGPIDEVGSRLILDALGAHPGDIVRLARLARGHPLALMLASAGVSEHPELALEDAAMTRVVDELTRLYLTDVEDPLTRQALEASSVVRRVTGPVVAAMLDAEDADATLGRLLDLPFVDACRDGLVVHEAVREAVAGFLRGTNPARYRRYRRSAWRELQTESVDAAPLELWRYTADMLYLIDNPVVREAFFPSGTQPLTVERLPAAEVSAVEAITHRHEGPEAAEIIRRWWHLAPHTFSVVRDRDGGAAGFFTLLDGGLLRLPFAGGDPVAATWARDLREHPLPKGQTALGLRRWLDADCGELPCASQAACWLDVKREYMAMRPALRRIYVVVRDVPTYWPVVERLGFRPLPGAPAQIDGADYTSVVLDFGPGSVDGWLSSLVATELGVADDERALDEEKRELVVRGEHIALTPLEFGLMRHLSSREGKTVTRHELLGEVWGTEFTGGSNVVDAVVRSLRCKLGDGAKSVETVRGSGYRLRAGWRVLERT